MGLPDSSPSALGDSSMLLLYLHFVDFLSLQYVDVFREIGALAEKLKV